MNSRTTRRFRELFAALPSHVKQQARQAYRLFRRGRRGLRTLGDHPRLELHGCAVGQIHWFYRAKNAVLINRVYG